jgi:hypothetical protein
MVADTADRAEITLRDAKRRRERDFVTLFNALWYRDFPIIRDHEDISQRAMWTTHIASVVKQCADLLGFFTRFETGNRTDAVIQKPSDKDSYWAKVEWEWKQALLERVNEIGKLAAADGTADVFIFVGYSKSENVQKSLEKIERDWKTAQRPLLVFLIIFDVKSDRRSFRTIQTHRFVNGMRRKLREQHALPWQVPGSKWQAMAQQPPMAASPSGLGGRD